MAIRDIRKILERLNDFCTKGLEAAVGSCLNRGHYELRWEHLFLHFVDTQRGDIPLILKRFGVDTAKLKQGLNKELENLRTGNTGKPTFSPPLLEAMEQAWMLGSLNYGIEKVSSGLLLLAAMEKGLTAVLSYGDVLVPVNSETLTGEFFKVVGQSEEHAGTSGAKSAIPTDAEGRAEVLKQFCANFTQQARDGKIDPILGRDDEIRQALDILNRRRKNNPILVGEAGVGKTAIVEGIALRIVSGDVPDHLKNVELWGLDLGLLQAGASVKGEFEKRLKNVIDTVKNSPTPIILFIDEAHTLIGAGGSAGMGDAANLLKPALARGELKTMAATTWAEYRKYFEKDPALARRFQLVKIEEPDEERCAIMLRGIAASYEKHHGVRITYDGIRSAVTLSHRYISGRQLPDKAVDVLDTAGARVKMSQSTKPASLDMTERKLLNAQLQLKTLERDRDAGLLPGDEEIVACTQVIETTQQQIRELTEKWEQEKQACAAIITLQEQRAAAKDVNSVEFAELTEQLNAEMDRLTEIQGETPMVFPHVSSAVCAQVISDWTGIPVGSMVKDEAQTLLTIESQLAERIIGQDDALVELANTIRTSRTGMGNPDAPLGVFLFAGPSGVGKTECAMALADLLFGGEKFLTVINMSEYQEKHTVSQLKGAPPGYVGYGEGGILTEAVRQKPYSLIVLDEVEKAHLEVMNLFYQVFDKGFMRDGEGREINFRNTVIIMTSNLAHETIVDLCLGENPPSQRELIDAIRPRLSAHFQPALLARCKVIPFRPLGTEIMRGIVALKLDRIAQRIMKNHGIRFSCAPQLIDSIAANCTAVEAGARNADAMIDQLLLPAISRELLKALGEEQEYTRLHVGQSADGEFEIMFGDDESMEESAGAEQEAAVAQEESPS